MIIIDDEPEVIGGVGISKKDIRTDIQNLDNLPSNLSESDRHLIRLVALHPKLGYSVSVVLGLNQFEKEQLLLNINTQLNIQIIK